MGLPVYQTETIKHVLCHTRKLYGTVRCRQSEVSPCSSAVGGRTLIGLVRGVSWFGIGLSVVEHEQGWGLDKKVLYV